MNESAVRPYVSYRYSPFVPVFLRHRLDLVMVMQVRSLASGS